ncbi:hypothetical protein ACFV5J_17925 [Streptomyces zaomyceticus]|uniref:hypothetical protein n=1 Tax=Streptomyces zaomyceticus TaxID=68286 RepID=UPI00364E60A3
MAPRRGCRSSAVVLLRTATSGDRRPISWAGRSFAAGTAFRRGQRLREEQGTDGRPHLVERNSLMRSVDLCFHSTAEAW